jgi:hypothetical protein
MPTIVLDVAIELLGKYQERTPDQRHSSEPFCDWRHRCFDDSVFGWQGPEG